MPRARRPRGRAATWLRRSRSTPPVGLRTREPSEVVERVVRTLRGRIAFTSNGGGGSDIYVVNADGTRLFSPTDAAGITGATPSWSPTGRQIAFVSSDCDPGGGFDLR